MSIPVSTGMGDVSRFDSRWRHFILVCNQPPQANSAFHPFGVDKLSSEQLYQMCAGRTISRHIFVGGSSASEAGNLTFLCTLLPQKPNIVQISQHTRHANPHINITIEMCRSKHCARDVPEMCRSCNRVVCGHRIGMFGYMSIPLMQVLVP